MSESSLLTLVTCLVLAGAGLIAGSLLLVVRKLVDEKYGLALMLIGMIFVLSPFYSVKKIGSEGIEFEMDGMISYFKGAEKKPPPDLKQIESNAASSIAQLSPTDKKILVAYRPNRKEDAVILIGLLQKAGFEVVPSAQSLQGERINIQYQPGITRIVYKRKEQEAIVDKIFKGY
jgi:hypothetical protein